MVYSGPGREMVPHFNTLGYPCPIYCNPLDFFVDLGTIDFRCVTSYNNIATELYQHIKYQPANQDYATFPPIADIQ